MRASWTARNMCIVAAAGVFTLGNMGSRQIVGIFKLSIDAALGNGQTFATAVAMREVLWGAVSPFAGHVAQRHGFGKVLALGLLVYTAGVMASSLSARRPWLFVLCFVVCGVGAGMTAIPVVLAATSSLLPARARPLASSMITAAASIGTAALAPAFRRLLSDHGWEVGILVLGGMTLPLLPLTLVLRTRSDGAANKPASAAPKPGAASGGGDSFVSVVLRGFSQRNYTCLVLGFFSCGAYVAHIVTHLRAPLLGAKP